MPSVKPLTTLAKVRFCRKQALEKKASEPVILDLRKVSGPADYFLLCSAQSEPQVKAICTGIIVQMKQEYNIQPTAMDGTPNSGWIVLDYDDVLIHVFHESKRAYYRLEDLWSDAAKVK